MAKQYTSLVNANVGSNEDGSPKKVFQKGQKIELTQKQAKYYKQHKYIK